MTLPTNGPHEIVSIETMEEWYNDTRGLLPAESDLRIKRLIGSNLTLLKANGAISFRHLGLKKAISAVVCLNIPMPDEVFVTLNSALEDDAP